MMSLGGSLQRWPLKKTVRTKIGYPQDGGIKTKERKVPRLTTMFEDSTRLISFARVTIYL